MNVKEIYKTMQNLLSLMYFLFALQRQSDIIVHIYTQEA